MFKNKRFVRYTVAFMFLGIFAMFFYSGLQNDHLNVLRQAAMDTFDYTQTQADMPATVAALAAVVFYLICGASFVKFGVRII
jgi:hypothetical protein